jgi:hypothetical protein
VSATPVRLEPQPEATTLARSADPFHNPTYPKRVHLLERAQLEDALRDCDQRLSAAFQKLNVLSNHAQRPAFTRLYHQMQGARDQVAEAVRRLPLETGGLYHEDHERFAQAMAAIERLSLKWTVVSG